MFFKLALSNVKKSIKDYTIYFLTLTFGVCLFYVFNSMGSQTSMMDLTGAKEDIFVTLNKIMGGVSIFISIILAFLILYANTFLIRRRKKELGIYMSLGMNKGKISKILIIETLFIGIFAFVVGLLIGVFASQGLSVLTAKLMEVNIKKFCFTFSREAAIKALVYFGVIFLIVMVFNTISISRYKLINLLYASKKNENNHIKKLWVAMILFIVSVACLVKAYALILNHGEFPEIKMIGLAAVLGCIGTLLFFMSLSGFVLKIVMHNKKFYYKGLNIFILKQINTTFISMTLICLMIFIAVSTMSCGLAITNSLTSDIKESTPYDASISISNYLVEGSDYNEHTLNEVLLSDGINLDDYSNEYLQYDLYCTDTLKYKEILLAKTDELKSALNLDVVYDSTISMMSLSDYNKLARMQGAEEIDLADDEYLITANYRSILPALQYDIDNNITIDLLGKTFKPYKKIVKTSLETTTMLMNAGTLVIPDDYFNSIKSQLKFEYSVIDLNYSGNSEDTEEAFTKIMEEKIGGYNADVGTSYITRTQVFDQSLGIKAIALFCILYIGIIFLITCAAVLALQQLSNSSDNNERYAMLRKIGVENGMLNKSLFVQVLINFATPLLLAIVHSAIAIIFVNNLMSGFGTTGLVSNIVMTGLFVLLIYGGYFIATYIGSKGIIKGKN